MFSPAKVKSSGGAERSKYQRAEESERTAVADNCSLKGLWYFEKLARLCKKICDNDFQLLLCLLEHKQPEAERYPLASSKGKPRSILVMGGVGAGITRPPKSRERRQCEFQCKQSNHQLMQLTICLARRHHGAP